MTEVIRTALTNCVKAGSSALVAVVTVLMLGACSDAEPAATAPESDALTPRQLKEKSAAGECFSIKWNNPEYSAAMADRPTTRQPVEVQVAGWEEFIAWLEAMPEPCTSGDELTIQTVEEAARLALARLESPTEEPT